MATLIAVNTNDGCVGRCDSRCYDAKLPDCDCICGGMNHGRGEQAAREATTARAAGEPLIRMGRRWCREHGIDPGHARFTSVAQQLDLFGDLEDPGRR